MKRAVLAVSYGVLARKKSLTIIGSGRAREGIVLAKWITYEAE